jgi:tetratricopeptide (TPR) repeat protein
VSAYTGRGNVNAALGRLTQAIADYKAAISLSPDTYTYCVLGITYTKTGDFTMAIAALEQGVNSDSAGRYPLCKTALDNAREGTPTP